MVFLMYRMPRSMHKEFAIAGVRDRIPGSIVYLPSVQSLLWVVLLNEFNRGVPSLPDDLKNLLFLGRNVFTNEPRPCDVVIYRSRLLLFCPNVEQQKVSLVHRQVVFDVRLVVRVRAVFDDRNDWSMRGEEPAR